MATSPMKLRLRRPIGQEASLRPSGRVVTPHHHATRGVIELLTVTPPAQHVGHGGLLPFLLPGSCQTAQTQR
jgi:hypothetical protein